MQRMKELEIESFLSVHIILFLTFIYNIYLYIIFIYNLYIIYIHYIYI